MEAGTSSSAKVRDFKERLNMIRSKRLEAARLNHKEVIEEDRLNKMPKNHLKKRERLEAELKEQEEKELAEKEGRDYNRSQLLNVSAVDAERWEHKKRKKNQNQGFSTYEEATRRQHGRLIKSLKPDPVEYEREKHAVGEAAFYGEDNTISIGLHKDSDSAIDNMVKDIEDQISKREKYSRRRTYDDDDDINFINERNMKFNKKLERFYGEYTQEIKQNLERGTAV